MDFTEMDFGEMDLGKVDLIVNAFNKCVYYKGCDRAHSVFSRFQRLRPARR